MITATESSLLNDDDLGTSDKAYQSPKKIDAIMNTGLLEKVAICQSLELSNFALPIFHLHNEE